MIERDRTNDGGESSLTNFGTLELTGSAKLNGLALKALHKGWLNANECIPGVGTAATGGLEATLGEGGHFVDIKVTDAWESTRAAGTEIAEEGYAGAVGYFHDLLKEIADDFNDAEIVVVVLRDNGASFMATGMKGRFARLREIVADKSTGAFKAARARYWEARNLKFKRIAAQALR